MMTPEDMVITLIGINTLYVYAPRPKKAGRQMSKIPAETSSTLMKDSVLVFISIYLRSFLLLAYCKRSCTAIKHV